MRQESPAPLTEEKRALRAQIRSRIAGLPAGYLREAGARIGDLVAQCPEYREAGTVMAFVSTAAEADLTPFLRRVLRDGKRLALPLCTGPGIMEARAVADLAQLRPGRYGIPEPGPMCPLLAPQALDLVVVPCVSCDLQGNRLGRGAGYYDRYLPRCGGKAIVICPEKLLRPRIPVSPLDRRVPVVVTERGICRTEEGKEGSKP